MISVPAPGVYRCQSTATTNSNAPFQTSLACYSLLTPPGTIRVTLTQSSTTTITTTQVNTTGEAINAYGIQIRFQAIDIASSSITTASPVTVILPNLREMSSAKSPIEPPCHLS